MFPLRISTSIKIPIILSVISALLFGFLCVGMFHKASVAMERMDVSGITAVAGEQTCCGGTMSQHMQSWTNTFLMTPNDLRNNFALLALVFLAALLFIRALFPYTPIDQGILTGNLYLRERSRFLAFDPLKLAFAQGILHPKLY